MELLMKVSISMPLHWIAPIDCAARGSPSRDEPSSANPKNDPPTNAPYLLNIAVSVLPRRPGRVGDCAQFSEFSSAFAHDERADFFRR